MFKISSVLIIPSFYTEEFDQYISKHFINEVSIISPVSQIR